MQALNFGRSCSTASVCLIEERYHVGGEVFSAVFLEEMACPFDFDLFARRVCAAEDPRITIGRKFAKATATLVARPLVNE